MEPVPRSREDITTIAFKTADYIKWQQAVKEGNVDTAIEIFYTTILSKANVPTVLQTAITQNDPKLVELVLDRAPTLDYNILLDLIMIANERKNKRIVRMLINYGLEKQSLLSMQKINLLHVAVSRGRNDEVNVLLDYGVDINVRDQRANTPLFHAIFLKKFDIIDTLMKRGARIDIVNNTLDTMVHIAALAGNLDLIKEMLAQGVSATEKNFFGKNALHFAALCQSKSTHVIEYLIHKGVPINVADDANFTPLHLALIGRKKEEVYTMVRYGADVNAKTKSGEFPLYLAVEYCSPSIVELLLTKGAEVNNRTKIGWSAIHAACQKGSKHKIEILLDYGADINYRNELIRPPLFWLDTRSIVAMHTLARHIAKLQFAKFYVHEENMLFINLYYEWNDYYNHCLMELDKMTKVKIYNNITAYHILTTSSLKLIPLFRNEEFIQAYKGTSRSTLFPLYVKELDDIFFKIDRQKDYYNLVNERLQYLFEEYLPDVAIEKIGLYITEIQELHLYNKR